MTNDQAKKKYPLLYRRAGEGWYQARCGMCREWCYPDVLDRDGTMIYSSHVCDPPGWEKMHRRIEISKDGTTSIDMSSDGQQLLEKKVIQLKKLRLIEHGF